MWLLTAALLVCAAASAQHGVRQLALWAQPMVWLVVLALLLSLVLSWKQLDFYELRPILSGGVKDLPKRVYLLLSVPFGEVFYAAAVLGGQGTRIRNGLLRACVLAGVLLSVLYLRNICLLGAEGARGVLYPSYTAASVLSFGEAFQRGEVLISGSLLVCTVARAALILSFFAGCVRAGSTCRNHTACGLGQYWRDCLAFYAQAAIKHLEWRKSCIRFCSCRSLSSRQVRCLQKCILRAAYSRS